MKAKPKLIGIADYIARQFADGCGPHESTVRRWIRAGQIRGRIIGSTYYVYESELDSTGNELADSILRAG